MLPSTLKFAIFSSILLVLSGCIYGGFWYIITLREGAMREELSHRAEKIAEQQKVSALASLFSNTQVERKDLHTYVVPEDGVTGFLELIERTLREHRLTVETKSVTIEALPGIVAFESLVVTLETTGSYQDTKQMLALVEAMPYQVSITSVSLERSGKDSGASWHGAVTIRVTKEK